MIAGCGGCDVGDYGQTKGVYRQRAMAMVDEKVGNARLSRDDASALLCGKKSCGGVVGTRSLRLRCLLPRLEGSNGNYCESLKHSVDHYSVCHQGGCIGGGLTQRRWLAQPPPINAWLTMTIICGGCGAGDCGHTEGVHRQRAVEIAEEEIGNARSSRDIASAWLRKKMTMLGLYRQRATTTLEGKMVTLGLDRRR
ncbi:hypothetical protein GW17_00043460 [Ensete ventricosum]|nr:hypothetical protein GW17_00043460 [Ensete ventricosum]